jgi:hypothetical protein
MYAIKCNVKHKINMMQDGSTALSIAVENGHRDVGVLIYAHLNYGRKGTPTTTQDTLAQSVATKLNVDNESSEANC